MRASLEARMETTDDLRALITDLRREFAEMRGDMNRQFTELRGDMNRRFEALDNKVDRDFRWLASVQVALMLAVVGALVGAYYR